MYRQKANETQHLTQAETNLQSVWGSFVLSFLFLDEDFVSLGFAGDFFGGEDKRRALIFFPGWFFFVVSLKNYQLCNSSLKQTAINFNLTPLS